MKMVKESMSSLNKCKKMRERDCRFVQPYMFEKLLMQSRMEFLWDTMMLDTRTTMKGRYKKDKYNYSAGDSLPPPQRVLGLLRPDPEMVLEDRAAFLFRAVARRKELEKKLRINLDGRKDPESHVTHV